MLWLSSKKMQYTAIILSAEEGGYCGFIEEIPGVNTQGETLDEIRENLRDALELVLAYRKEQMDSELQNKKNVIKEALVV